MDLRSRLLSNWYQQLEEGFILGNISAARDIEVRNAQHGVAFRHRYLPHRAFRGDREYLKKVGVIRDWNPNDLYCDPRDPGGHPCFLCATNVAKLFPKERLLDVSLGGLRALAGANFAWITRDHYTVMAEQHQDQAYSASVLDFMVRLHDATGFRVFFNGPGAGASIPLHLHLQISSEAMPIEDLAPEKEALYPTAVRSFAMSMADQHDANLSVVEWLGLPGHTVSIVVIPGRILVFPRSRARPGHPRAVGAFELAGLIVEDELLGGVAHDRAHDILASVRP